MNEVLFHEGGQPVCLDDLELIQENSKNAVALILSALGGDLDQEEIFFVKKPTVTKNGTKASFSAGSLWHHIHGLVQIVPVTELDLGVTGRAYIRISVSDSRYRTFENGQSHTTRKSVTASIVNTSTGNDYIFSEIKDLMSALSSLIDKEDKSSYQEVNVEWANGYTGKVEVKTIQDGYRYHVKARSLQEGEWPEIGKLVCSGPFPVSAVSGMFMTGGDTPARDSEHYLKIIYGEGYMELVGNSSFGPSSCPIDVTFDVLGNPFDEE